MFLVTENESYVLKLNVFNRKWFNHKVLNVRLIDPEANCDKIVQGAWEIVLSRLEQGQDTAKYINQNLKTSIIFSSDHKEMLVMSQTME